MRGVPTRVTVSFLLTDRKKKEIKKRERRKEKNNWRKSEVRLF